MVRKMKNFFCRAKKLTTFAPQCLGAGVILLSAGAWLLKHNHEIGAVCLSLGAMLATLGLYLLVNPEF